MKKTTKGNITVLFIAMLIGMLAFKTKDACIVSGIVTEKGTADALVSANVMLNQNGSLVSGAVTDIDGKFCISNVKDGTYDLVVKYVGYTDFEKKGIVIKDGKSEVLKIELAQAAKNLDMIVVTGAKYERKMSEQTVSMEVLRSSNLMSVTSSKYKGGRSGYGKANYNAAYDMAPAPPAPRYDLDDEPNVKPKQPKPDEISNTEEYDHIVENEFLSPVEKALSTFSIDVDVASYGMMRKKIEADQRPAKESIRLEEMINYFTYDYANPTDGTPFSTVTEVGECPWNNKHQLLQIGIQGLRMDKSSLPASNLVFLIDVSGSMSSPDKLPLVKQSLTMLVKELKPEDRIALVVYAGSSGLVLPSTPCSQKDKIIDALDRLSSGGSTAGAAGINQAYEVAKANFLPDGNNRVILCTDGDFNVGVSSDADLTALIEKKREEGVFLSVLGFGMGNYKDSKMEKLADKGNGNYAYIDNINEGKKNLVTQMGGTLLTIAKDVKIQVEFNPAKVKAYRLLGYENRALADKDFNDDKKDAGEIGAGASVTALYEIVTDENDPSFKEMSKTDKLKYQKTEANAATTAGDEMATVKIRYKQPKESKSQLLEYAVKNEVKTIDKTSDNFRFAAAVASFGMLLRDSKFKGNYNYDKVRELAVSAKGADAEGYRAEFIKLVREAKDLPKVAER
ncbi:MAG TPA: von Willebrand factor type A domain-containing protein [Chitinophagales bacterium]|nr:von Willebrand factor type A domain-containing protein [Chitinophagales bacterium]